MKLSNTTASFEAWFVDQDFYVKMRFMYGDTLFIKTNGVYDRLHVQMAWTVWQELATELEKISAKINRIPYERNS